MLTVYTDLRYRAEPLASDKLTMLLGDSGTPCMHTVQSTSVCILYRSTVPADSRSLGHVERTIGVCTVPLQTARLRLLSQQGSAPREIQRCCWYPFSAGCLSRSAVSRKNGANRKASGLFECRSDNGNG